MHLTSRRSFNDPKRPDNAKFKVTCSNDDAKALMAGKVRYVYTF